MIKVCILTSVHPLFDTRIFHKEARSLAKAGYDVTLVVQHDKKDVVDGIRIVPLSKPKSRFERMTRTAWQVYCAAMAEDAGLYHFHDPELILVGLLLRMRCKKVVYDVHEDLPRQTMSKHYLPQYLKKPLAWFVEVVENTASRYFSAICTATPYIRDRFKKVNDKSLDINNYPILTELACSDVKWGDRLNKICYIGVIAKVRGIVELVNAMEEINGELDLAGRFSPASLRAELIDKPGWKKVNELGFVGRDRVKSVLATSRAGMVTLYPIINYLDSLPVKMFEYMAAGIPVIASDFPFWQEIIERHNCGICVDPYNQHEIARAVNTLLTDNKLAAVMGANGRKAVEEGYNWQNEERKLLDLYQELI
ncbi:MAG: glycosyltransferase family 4 protein [Deltaproteobacteria bacterium]|nr:glycosyltransferase family 4 protein [Deltaproteobacteria bacterium]